MIFDADLSSIDEGVWKTYEGTEFLIAHISNNKFQRELAKVQQPHRRKIQDGSIDPELNKSLICHAMAVGIVLNWRKMKSRDGAEVPYNVASAKALLLRNSEFRDWVSDVAMTYANFREDEVQEMGEG